MQLRSSSILLVLCLGAFATLVGWEQSAHSAPPAKPSAEPGSKPAADAGGFPAALWLATEPANAKPVGEVKKSAAAGQDVVIFGRIGGSRDPFIKGRAMFTLVDRSVPSCKELHEDECPTPWDYCCEPKKSLLANMVTVQVVGPDGKPLKHGLSDVHGLTPLAELVITGKVSATGGNVVIDALGIYVKK